MSEPRRFRKKAVEVEARLFDGDPDEKLDVYLWVANEVGHFDLDLDEIPAQGVSIDGKTGFIMLATQEGLRKVKPGWWIIRGVRGNFYPCKPLSFAALFEPVEETSGVH